MINVLKYFKIIKINSHTLDSIKWKIKLKTNQIKHQNQQLRKVE